MKNTPGVWGRSPHEKRGNRYPSDTARGGEVSKEVRGNPTPSACRRRTPNITPAAERSGAARGRRPRRPRPRQARRAQARSGRVSGRGGGGAEPPAEGAQTRSRVINQRANVMRKPRHPQAGRAGARAPAEDGRVRCGHAVWPAGVGAGDSQPPPRCAGGVRGGQGSPPRSADAVVPYFL